jgi:hypothetical protein
VECFKECWLWLYWLVDPNEAKERKFHRIHVYIIKYKCCMLIFYASVNIMNINIWINI